MLGTQAIVFKRTHTQLGTSLHHFGVNFNFGSTNLPNVSFNFYMCAYDNYVRFYIDFGLK